MACACRVRCSITHVQRKHAPGKHSVVRVQHGKNSTAPSQTKCWGQHSACTPTQNHMQTTAHTPAESANSPTTCRYVSGSTNNLCVCVWWLCICVPLCTFLLQNRHHLHAKKTACSHSLQKVHEGTAWGSVVYSIHRALLAPCFRTTCAPPQQKCNNKNTHTVPPHG